VLSQQDRIHLRDEFFYVSVLEDIGGLDRDSSLTNIFASLNGYITSISTVQCISLFTALQTLPRYFSFNSITTVVILEDLDITRIHSTEPHYTFVLSY
jgi:hypothetical protein